MDGKLDICECCFDDEQKPEESSSSDSDSVGSSVLDEAKDEVGDHEAADESGDEKEEDVIMEDRERSKSVVDRLEYQCCAKHYVLTRMSLCTQVHTINAINARVTVILSISPAIRRSQSVCRVPRTMMMIPTNLATKRRERRPSNLQKVQARNLVEK